MEADAEWTLPLLKTRPPRRSKIKSKTAERSEADVGAGGAMSKKSTTQLLRRSVPKPGATLRIARSAC